MKLTFNIHYTTQWGQQIYLCGSIPELGNGDPKQALLCQYIEHGQWQQELVFKKAPKSFDYQYLVKNDQGEIIDQEWGTPRSLIPPKSDKVQVQDHWRSQKHADNVFYSSAFTKVIFKPDLYRNKAIRGSKTKAMVRFQIAAPRVAAGHQLCVCGNIPALGNWDLEKPILLNNENYPLWAGEVSFNSKQLVEYKYGFYDPKSKKVLALEAGPNRRLAPHRIPSTGEYLVNTDEYFLHPDGYWRGAGIAIPVFSLRSKNGLGVGEFKDLTLLVDWAAKLGLKMVQILPINDTSGTKTWVDSYPYSCLSTYALHPLYLNVEELEGSKKILDRKKLAAAKKKLNALAEIDYEAVMDIKSKYARQVFDQQKKTLGKDSAFQQFIKDNQHWLPAYALFCYRRDQNGTADFNQWKTDAVFTAKGLKAGTSPKAKHYDEIAFYYFLQYHLDRQLKTAADYARAHGIILKGDIPIGIYRYSVDAWMEPHLFNMNGQSGAPPDPFSETGQNWGFPTYNWQEMAKDGYQWWQNRLKQLSAYFDAFRIDHILGFFRIWQIPLEQVDGALGFFNPAIPIQLSEFAGRNIAFNYQRYCQPYLSPEIIQEQFGKDAKYVIQTFLDQINPEHFQLKEKFSTQRKIDHFLQQAKQKSKLPLRVQLFNLVSNVLFMEVEGSEGMEFHPRIDLQKTASFQALDTNTQNAINDLYQDYFYHRQEDFWRAQAMTKLPVIKAATNMMICGEDLGMVPDCVAGVMEELGFLSLEIQRMSKNPKTEFLQSKDIPYLSVASPSTHDMSTIRTWWEEMEGPQRLRFYQQEIGRYDTPSPECTPLIAGSILRQHLFWPGMWTVFPIQELLAIDGKLRRADAEAERINVPANPQHYWRYRFHMNLEELMEEEAFNERLRELFITAGRG